MRLRYRSAVNDTSPEAHRIQMAIYARMPAGRRIRQAVSRSESLRKMVWQRVAEAHPQAAPDRLRRLFAERWLGPELARRVYGGLAD